MKLSETTRIFRDLVQDPDATHWPDAEVARLLHQAQLRMFSIQCSSDPSYYNLELNILGSSARQVASQVFEYDLPQWIHRVSRVRKASGSSTSRREPNIPQGSMRVDRPGWFFSAAKVLQLIGFTRLDLTLGVCKKPARPHRGTSPAAGSASTLVLQAANAAGQIGTDADPFKNYDQETELDGYRNAIVEITGPVSGVRNPTGQIRRCIASTRALVSSAVRTTVSVQPDFAVTPASSDTYEMHVEVDDAHVRYLVLLAAQYGWQKQQNVSAIASIQKELGEEDEAFKHNCRQRMNQDPLQWNMGEADVNSEADPDRIPPLIGYL